MLRLKCLTLVNNTLNIEASRNAASMNGTQITSYGSYFTSICYVLLCLWLEVPFSVFTCFYLFKWYEMKTRSIIYNSVSVFYEK